MSLAPKVVDRIPNQKGQTQFDLKNAQQNCKVAQMPLSNLRHIMEILFQMSPNEIGANRFFGMVFLRKSASKNSISAALMPAKVKVFSI